jgi:hypothetical protein
MDRDLVVAFSMADNSQLMEQNRLNRPYEVKTRQLPSTGELCLFTFSQLGCVISRKIIPQKFQNTWGGGIIPEIGG